MSTLAISAASAIKASLIRTMPLEVPRSVASWNDRSIARRLSIRNRASAGHGKVKRAIGGCDAEPLLLDARALQRLGEPPPLRCRGDAARGGIHEVPPRLLPFDPRHAQSHPRGRPHLAGADRGEAAAEAGARPDPLW